MSLKKWLSKLWVFTLRWNLLRALLANGIGDSRYEKKVLVLKKNHVERIFLVVVCRWLVWHYIEFCFEGKSVARFTTIKLFLCLAFSWRPLSLSHLWHFRFRRRTQAAGQPLHRRHGTLGNYCLLWSWSKMS